MTLPGGGRHDSTASCNWWGQSKCKCSKHYFNGHWCRELIVLKPIYDTLGCPLASALVGFHSFTGCDTAGLFSGKSKITCWKSFKKADKTTAHWFIDLGQADIPPEATISALERYICQLYLPGAGNEDPGSVSFFLFKKNEAVCENLLTAKTAPAHTLCQLPSQNMASSSYRESHTCLSDRTWMDKRGGLYLSCENIT